MVDEITDARVNVDGVDTRSDADRDNGHVPVLIVGGGQAGLSTSHLLKKRGIAHVVLERNTASAMPGATSVGTRSAW